MFEAAMAMDSEERHGSDRSVFETHFIATSHGDIAYFDEGAGEALIWVHGLGGEFSHFEHVAPAFSARYRTIGLDLPGCGQSCKPDSNYSTKVYANAVLEVMTQLGVESATLIGHSAGGLVCAEAALLKPHRVTRLVLIDSAGIALYPRALRVMAQALLQPWFLTRTLEQIATPLLDRVFHRRNDYTARFITKAINRPKHPLLGELAKVFHDLGPDLVLGTIGDHAERFTMPTLMVWGDRDRLVPLAKVARVAARLPDCELAVIEECGHMPMIECPELFIPILDDFLENKRRRTDA